MTVSLSKHSINRAKERFKYSESTLLRLATKALVTGDVYDTDIGVNAKHGDKAYIFSVADDIYTLITIQPCTTLNKKLRDTTVFRGGEPIKKEKLYKKGL